MNHFKLNMWIIMSSKGKKKTRFGSRWVYSKPIFKPKNYLAKRNKKKKSLLYLKKALFFAVGGEGRRSPQMCPSLPSASWRLQHHHPPQQFRFDRLTRKSIFSGKVYLKVSVCMGRQGITYGSSLERLMGKVSVTLDLARAKSRACVCPR